VFLRLSRPVTGDDRIIALIRHRNARGVREHGLGRTGDCCLGPDDGVSMIKSVEPD
jgi:hypothetical protein